VKLAHLAGASDEPPELPPAAAPTRPERKTAGKPTSRPAPRERSARPAPPTKPEVRMARIYIGSGRNANMRPGDLVGAIANEAGIDARNIGAIEIAERHSLVELPESLVTQVVTALRATTIKGKRQTVRRDLANRPGGSGRPA